MMADKLMRQRAHKNRPGSKVFHIFNPLGKKLEQGETCREDTHRRQACGPREGWYVGYEADTPACERFLGATGSSQYQRGCVYLHCVA